MPLQPFLDHVQKPGFKLSQRAQRGINFAHDVLSTTTGRVAAILLFASLAYAGGSIVMKELGREKDSSEIHPN